MHEQRPMTQTMKASEGRQLWSKMLNDVFRKKTRVIVERNDIPIAAIVSVDDFERLQRLEQERAQRFRVLDEIGAAFADVAPDELDRQAAKAVSAVRSERKRTARPTRTP